MQSPHPGEWCLEEVIHDHALTGWLGLNALQERRKLRVALQREQHLYGKRPYLTLMPNFHFTELFVFSFVVVVVVMCCFVTLLHVLYRDRNNHTQTHLYRPMLYQTQL